jgi:hypothetical protein
MRRRSVHLDFLDVLIAHEPPKLAKAVEVVVDIPLHAVLVHRGGEQLPLVQDIADALAHLALGLGVAVVSQLDRPAPRVVA